MAEHRIRFRGGWSWGHPGAGVSSGPPRVTLPLSWPPDRTTPASLGRRFQAPPLDHDRENLALELDDVPGLRCVRLNDAELARPAAGTVSLRIPLSVQNLMPRNNLLVLVVDPAAAIAGGEGWGKVALLIGRRGEGTGASDEDECR